MTDSRSNDSPSMPCLSVAGSAVAVRLHVKL
jgi:hypothetical protein